MARFALKYAEDTFINAIRQSVSWIVRVTKIEHKAKLTQHNSYGHSTFDPAICRSGLLQKNASESVSTKLEKKRYHCEIPTYWQRLSNNFEQSQVISL